jgi:hypothetical protein
MALASSWAAYRIIVYEMLHGPAEIQTIGAVAPGRGRGWVGRATPGSDDRIGNLECTGDGSF